MSKKNALRRYEITVLLNRDVNFLSYLAHGILSQIGFRLVNAATFVAAYLLMLSGGSNLFFGTSTFLSRAWPSGYSPLGRQLDF